MNSTTNGALLFSASVVTSVLGTIMRGRKSKSSGGAGPDSGSIAPLSAPPIVEAPKTVVESIADDTPSTTVSAPGKALIAGGYLVLEQPNIGVTISSTSRFYSTVKLMKTKREARSKYQLTIEVESPQFGTSFEYEYDIHFDSLKSTSAAKNLFVEKCLSMVLSYTKESLTYGVLSDIIANVAKEGKLGVKLRADNDFYSQIKELKGRNLPLLPASLQTLPRFNPCPKNAEGNTEVVKTGMGSSAALATSLVGALLQWFGVIRLGHRAGEDDRRVLHNLAQLAHAVAQGKIGSGFDVAAAVYGTQMYKRFSAEGLSSVLGNPSPSEIHTAVNDRSLWGQTTAPFSLPPGVDLLMGDVCGGSSSVSMAREVLKWRKDKPEESLKIWSELAAVNQEIYTALQELSSIASTDPTGYMEAITRASESTYVQWGRQRLTQSPKKIETTTVMGVLSGLRKLFSRLRELMRLMGSEAGVEIEPPQQTILADRTEGMSGVLCAGVPGAGGNDAIFAIVLSSKSRERVEEMWSQWGCGLESGPRSSESGGEGTVVCPLLLKAEGGLKSGVRAEFDINWD